MAEIIIELPDDCDFDFIYKKIFMVVADDVAAGDWWMWEKTNG